ncbi:MAG: hypothetical protein R6U70_10615 [Bacillota bacterium]
MKRQIAALSLVAYLFYGYGIYVIEQIYSPLYLLYMAIFAFSFWSLAYAIADVQREVVHKIRVSRSMRYLTVSCLIMIPSGLRRSYP